MRVTGSGSIDAPPETEDRSSLLQRYSTPWRLLLGVGLLYVIAQFALFWMPRFLGYDEAIYVAEVTPGMRAISFSATRARGITFLISPVTALGGSVGMIRAFLALASGLFLVAAFRVWIPLIGRTAALAAAFLGFTWLGLFYGSAIFPNIFVAFCAVAAAGFAARAVVHDEPRATAWAGVAVGIAALFRPMEAVWMAAGIGLVILVRDPRRAVRRLLPIGVGLVVGWTPWLVEGAYRFGGPLARLRGSVNHADGFGVHVVDHLRLADGPLFGTPGRFGPIPLFAVLWWAALLGFSAVAVVRARRSGHGAPVATAAVAGGALAFPYLFLVGILNPRFLLPAYALAGIPAAVGVVSLWPRGGSTRARALTAVPLVALIGVLGVWHAGLANAIEHNQVRLGRVALELGRTLKERSDGRPCVFASLASFPQIEFASGCDGARLNDADNGELAALAARARQGVKVFVLSSRRPPQGSLLLEWSEEPLVLRSSSNWTLYEP